MSIISSQESTEHGAPLEPRIYHNPLLNEKEAMEDLLALLKERILAHELTAEGLSYAEDVVLIQYILGKKGDVDKAFKALLHGAHGYLGVFGDTLLTHYPFHLRAEDSGWGRLLRQRDSLGRLVVIMRVSHFDEKQYNTLEDIVRELVYTLHTVIRFDEGCCKIGVVVIYDLRGWKWSHVKLAKILLTTSFAKGQELLANFLNTNPMRIKAFHFLNHTRIFNPIIAFGKSFLPEKLQKRINLHNKVDTLKEHFDPDILPRFLGENLEDKEAYDETFREKLIMNEEYFEKFKENVDGLGDRYALNLKGSMWDMILRNLEVQGVESKNN